MGRGEALVVAWAIGHMPTNNGTHTPLPIAIIINPIAHVHSHVAQPGDWL